MNFQLPEPTDDELDRLLSRAVWPEPDVDSMRRWWQFKTRRSPIIWRSAIAVAASVVIALAGLWWTRPTDVVPIVAVVVKPPTVAPEPIMTDRPPTAAESAMLRVVAARAKTRRPVVVATSDGVPLIPTVTGWSSKRAPEPITVRTATPVDVNDLARRMVAETDDDRRDQLADRLVSNGPRTPAAARVVTDLFMNADARKSVIGAVGRHPHGWVDVLFSAMNDPRIPVRSAAAEALAKIDGPVVTARLIAMADRDVNRREAVDALVRIDSADAKQYVESAKQNIALGGIVRSALAQLVTN